MLKRVCVSLLCASVFALVACGGGGGGGGDTGGGTGTGGTGGGTGGGGGGGGGGSTPQTPVSEPFNPAPPAIGSAPIELSRAPTGCASDCFEGLSLDIDAAGETTAFWRGRVTGSYMFHGANLDGASVLSQASVGPVSFGNSINQAVRLADRRHLMLYLPSPGSFTSQTVTFGTSGSGTLSAPVVLPSPLRSDHNVVTDLDGSLFAITGSTTAPFPEATLADGVSMAMVTPGAHGYSGIAYSAYASSSSVARQVPWAVIGWRPGSTTQSVYLQQVSRDSGQVLPPTLLSTGTVDVGNGTGCTAPVLRVQAIGPSQQFVSWRQANSNHSGCDLMVDGRRVNASTWSVDLYQVSATAGGAAVAVWDEINPTVTVQRRLMFATRAAANAAWSTPVPVQAGREALTSGIYMAAAGPDRTLVVAWYAGELCPNNTCATITRHLASRYVNGAWTTSTMPSGTVRKLTINPTGQAAILLSDNQCGAGASTSCSRLGLLRF